jgi:acyl dehydratase
MPHIDLTPGVELAAFARPAGLAAWIRYAAVMDEFNDIHMDADAGRAAGFPGAIGMGNLSWSYFHSLLRAWLGEAGTIDQVRTRYDLPALEGTTVTARGRIAAVAPAVPGATVTLDLWVEDDAGRRIVTGQAVVTVQLD